MLNPDHPAARLADILTDADAGALILAPGCAAPSLPHAIPLVTLHAPETADAEGVGSEAGTWGAPPPASQDAPGVVVYTSGSTGRPKGIVRSQRQMLVRVGHRIGAFRLGPADRTLLLYPVSSGPGITAVLAALLSGGAVHVANASASGARFVLGVAREAGITTVSSVPALLRTLLALDGAGAAFARLRSVYTTSESLLRQDIDAWRSVLPRGCAVWIGYGLTEGAPLAGWFVSTEVPDAVARLPIGYPIPWHDLAITDARGAPVPDGQAGEFWARGRLLSLGEWRRGRCVPGRLLADPDDPLGGILRTGDLVRRRPDGLLEFLGRVDEQIRIRGNRVEPAELEHVLRETPGVADAAVLALRTQGDPLLAGFVVPDGVVPAARLRQVVTARLHATLPPYLRPARLHVVPAVPRLPGGKIDPGALERLDEASVARRGSVARGPLARLRRLVGFG
jgi:acyl-coenzyme A synthetase/AMP-(fatty) acid ligase